MSEPDYETIPLKELIALYEQKADAFRKRNKTINRMVDARQARTLNQKVQGRTARARLMGDAHKEVKEMGKIVKRRLAAEAGEVLDADPTRTDNGR